MYTSKLNAADKVGPDIGAYRKPTCFNHSFLNRENWLFIYKTAIEVMKDSGRKPNLH